MDPDPLGDSEGYYGIRSLYFDSVDWRCFADKQAGLAVRHRLRVRGYMQSGGGPIFGIKFEIKHRRNDRIAKVVARIGDGYECLRPFFRERPLPSDHPLAGSLELRQFFGLKTIHSLLPVVNVQFRRQAFVARSDTTVRVTLDGHLSARPARDLLEPWPGKPVSIIGRDTILEIKVHRSLPFWVRRLIQKYRLQKASISKYCRSVAHCPFGLDASS